MINLYVLQYQNLGVSTTNICITESVALLLTVDFVGMGCLEIIVWFLLHCQVYAVPLGGMCVRQRMAIGGSGSTYVYGYVDSHVNDVKTKKECLEFVTNSK